jgi:hypothetical protein
MAIAITDKNTSLDQFTVDPLSPLNPQRHIHNQNSENNILRELDTLNDISNSQSKYLRPSLFKNDGSFIEDIRKRGGTLVGRYTNDFTQVRVQCDFKHIFDITPRDVLRNNWCPMCTEGKPFDLKSIDLLPTYNSLSE